MVQTESEAGTGAGMLTVDELADATGVSVRWAEVDLETGELPTWQYEHLIGRHTRLVTISLGNPATGTIPDVRGIANLAHDAGDLWTRAANYHSRTPSLNADYRAQIMLRGARWAGWLHVRWPNLALASTSLVFRPPASPVMRPASVGAALRAITEVPVVFT